MDEATQRFRFLIAYKIAELMRSGDVPAELWDWLTVGAPEAREDGTYQIAFEDSAHRLFELTLRGPL